MEIYKSQNRLVTKYIHDDGSETVIKTTPEGEEGCGQFLLSRMK